jgi:hypothetical protein
MRLQCILPVFWYWFHVCGSHGAVGVETLQNDTALIQSGTVLIQGHEMFLQDDAYIFRGQLVRTHTKNTFPNLDRSKERAGSNEEALSSGNGFRMELNFLNWKVAMSQFVSVNMTLSPCLYRFHRKYESEKPLPSDKPSLG